MLTPRLSFVLLFVKDAEKSAQFYGQLLGLKPVEQGPLFALFILQNVKLGLWAYKDAEPPVTAPAGGSEIAFEVDDIDATYQQWLEHGIPMAQAPTDMDFGRTFLALDPDGHRIRIFKYKQGFNKA